MQILLAKFFCLWNASVTVAGLRRQQGAVSWAVRRGWPPCSGSSLNQGIGVYVSLPVYVGLQKQHRLNDHLGALCCPEKCVDLDGQMARKSQPNCYTLMSILFLISFFTRRFTGSSCIDSFVNKRPNSEAEATMKSRGSINKLALLLAVFIQVNSNKKWYNICRFRSRRHGKPIFWREKNPFLFSLAKKNDRGAGGNMRVARFGLLSLS